MELKFVKTYIALSIDDGEFYEVIFLDNHTDGNGKNILAALSSNGEIFQDFKDWKEVHRAFIIVD